jgi:hypothetical protein
MFMFGILGILAVLLGVMSYVVTPKPPAPPTPEEQAAKQEQQKMIMQEQSKQREKEMKKMMAIQKQMDKAAQASKVAKPNSKLGGLPPPQTSPGGSPQIAGQMDISENWFKKRQDGEIGLAKLEKEASAPKAHQAPPIPPALLPPSETKSGGHGPGDGHNH